MMGPGSVLRELGRRCHVGTLWQDGCIGVDAGCGHR